MKIAILGNSGSGKSTMAKRWKELYKIPYLELDSIVWEPNQIAVLRKKEEIDKDIENFLQQNTSWIVEGCYGELIEKCLPEKPTLYFLHPGEQTCIENNQKRLWEPHKYNSKEEQDKMFNNLIQWVKGYYQRNDAWSLQAHQEVFEKYQGPKQKLETNEQIRNVTLL